MTVAGFESLPDHGNLRELDEGELIVMSPPETRHGIVQSAVAEVLRQAARKAVGGIVVRECGFRPVRILFALPTLPLSAKRADLGSRRADTASSGQI